MSIQRRLRLFVLSTALAATPLGAAWAQDVDAALARLKVLVEEQGAKLEWQSVEEDGADATLVGVSVGGEEGMVPIGDVHLTGIEETDDGFRIGEVSMDRYVVEDGSGSTVTVDGVAMTGVVVPNEGAQDALGGFLVYETADLANVNVSVDGKEMFTLSNMHVEVTLPEDGSPMAFTGAAEEFSVDLSVVEDPKQLATIQALGLETVTGFFEIAGSWQPTDGRMALTQYDLTVADAGSLGFTFDIGGYTPDFIASLRELQKKMMDNPDAENSEQGLAMLGLMQQLTFHGAEISFADDSITGKVLEYVAQQQGMKASDVANQAKAILPFAMAQLNNPELTAMVTQAVSAFLDDPQSLTVTAAPAQPVPFALIMAGAMSTPQDLPKTLGVTVSANE